MYIRGTSKPCCGLCEYAFFDKDENKLVCKLNDEAADSDSKCKKFRYDIYKYEPMKKADFTNFSKEDFEL